MNRESIILVNNYINFKLVSLLLVSLALKDESMLLFLTFYYAEYTCEFDKGSNVFLLQLVCYKKYSSISRLQKIIIAVIYCKNKTYFVEVSD